MTKKFGSSDIALKDRLDCSVTIQKLARRDKKLASRILTLVSRIIRAFELRVKELESEIEYLKLGHRRDDEE